jgi:hypothetical protein
MEPDNNLNQYLKKAFKNIDKSYEIVDSEIEDIDKDGYIYWYMCKNNYNGGWGDIHYMITTEKQHVIDNIKKNGLVVDDVTYYYNHEKLNDININKINKIN